MALEKQKRKKERGGKRGKGEAIEMAETHGQCNATRPVTFTSSVTVEFLSVTTVDTGGGGGGLGHSLLWGLHPWLYPGAATSASPPVVTTRDVSRHYPMSLGVQKSPQWRTT